MIDRTRHQLRAAVQVARLIDASGSFHEDARGAYLTNPTRSTFAPEALRVAEGLLLEAGLLRLIDGRLLPTPGLATLTNSTEDEQGADILEGILAELSESADRSETGAAGEVHVLELVQADLIGLHRQDLAIRCEQVSLVSDWFGYDLIAPRIDGSIRRLEVKTMTSKSRPAMFRFFISRNEYDTGRTNAAEWSLVACTRHPQSGAIELLGWCRAADLSPYLPVDQHGRWTEAQVSLPATNLMPEFPAAV